jgi:arylsulfatase A-like enzyme
MTGRVLLSCAAILITAHPGRSADGGDRANFVVIVIDDLGWADLACYGSTFYKTPNIDDLARRGVRFTNGYAACPVCSPTRAALLTGRSPARLRLTDWLPGRPDRPDQRLLRPTIRQHLPLEELTIAEALKPAGYLSASIGKWHLGSAPFGPEKQGFDLNVAGTETGSPPGGYFRFKTPTVSARDDREYLTDRLTEEAVRFVEENRARPFFLYLPHYAVHIPLQAKEGMVATFRSRARPDGAQNNAIYAAMIASVDEGVGRIMTKLRELAIDDRTVVVFTSDNGGLSVREGPNTPATSNEPLRTGKGYLYEGGIRVPWIIAGPAVSRPGTTCDVPVSSLDLFPTILQLAGVRPPEVLELDGESLVPLLRANEAPRRQALYWHYPHYSNQGGKPGGAIRAGDHKLIEFFEDGRVELYELRHDMGERHDLVDREPGTAARLRKALADWRTSVGAQLPRPNPAYRPPAR